MKRLDWDGVVAAVVALAILWLVAVLAAGLGL